MEIMTKLEINNEVGKKLFLADDNTLAAKLIYISGINGFDEYLGEKDQKDLGCVIHINERPKGIILRLAKNFSAKETAIDFKKIKQVGLIKDAKYSIIKITKEVEQLFFGLDNNDSREIVDFFKKLKKISFDENCKGDIPKEVKDKIEKYLIKNTDILPINMDTDNDKPTDKAKNLTWQDIFKHYFLLRTALPGIVLLISVEFFGGGEGGNTLKEGFFTVLIIGTAIGFLSFLYVTGKKLFSNQDKS